MYRRKICVVTGSRADYGHLQWLMQAIQDDEALELQCVATGMHFASEYGSTYKIIEEDGFRIQHAVHMLLSYDSPNAVVKSLGIGVIGFAQAFEELKPDLLLVLGDRFEILASVQAALFYKIPVAHLHGGEATYGAMDDAIRNAITKMAHLHFVAAPEYAKKVIRMGEDPKYVYDYGPPGLDAIRKIKPLEKQEITEAIGFNFGKYNFLVTYHPETLSNQEEAHVECLLAALSSFPEAHILFTATNADISGKKIIQSIQKFVESDSFRYKLVSSLGQKSYYSFIHQVDVVIGNSSSGLNEVPHFRKPTVNIGNRQDGRISPPSVLHTENTSKKIYETIVRAMSKEHQQTIENMELPTNLGNISFSIKEKIKSLDLTNIIKKEFYWVENE